MSKDLQSVFATRKLIELPFCYCYNIQRFNLVVSHSQLLISLSSQTVLLCVTWDISLHQLFFLLRVYENLINESRKNVKTKKLQMKPWAASLFLICLELLCENKCKFGCLVFLFFLFFFANTFNFLVNLYFQSSDSFGEKTQPV